MAPPRLQRMVPSRSPLGGPPGKRTTGGRLARRILLVVALCVVAFLTQRNSFQQASDAIFGPRIDWHSDYAMSNRLYDLIVRRHLTDVPRACLLINIHGGDPASATGLDVFERPTQACMGAAHAQVRVLPRLFGMIVDRDTGQVQTDAGTPGHYRFLS